MAYEIKTKLNDGDVKKFLNSVEDPQRRSDALEILDVFVDITKEEPKMWGSSIVGFGTYKYTNTSKKEMEWMKTGFSPRKNALTMYIMPGYNFGNMPELMDKLGKYTTGKSCLYIKKLSDVDMTTLKEIIKLGIEYMDEKYPN